MAASPRDAIKLGQENDAKFVDLRFSDLPGLKPHCTVTFEELTEEAFDEGYGFDGSSIRGFQEIQESDMLLVPDPNTAVIDPFREHTTLSINCYVQDPITGEPYTRDPRYVAKKAEGYVPVPPMDSFQDLRSEMILTLEKLGVEIEVQHHEVGTAGQAEIDMRFDTLLTMADKLMLYKYVVKNVAHSAGYTVTFMPKPIFQDNGSGMHVHQSLWKGGEPLMFDEKGYGQISDLARWYIGGLLKHAAAVLAFAAPTTNSYKRLVPGYEAPV